MRSTELRTEKRKLSLLRHNLSASTRDAKKECGISSTEAYGIRQTEVRRRLKSEVRYQATEHMGIDETFLSLRQEDGKRGEKSLFVTVMATRPGESAVASTAELENLTTDDAKAAEKKYGTGVVAFAKMSTKTEDVAKLFREMDDFDKVKTMTMDMSRSFLAAVRDVNPSIIVIIDRFHVIQSLNDKTKRTATAIYEASKAKLLSQIKALEKADNADPNRLRELRKKERALEQHYRNDRFGKNSENLSENDRAHFAELKEIAPELFKLYKLKEKMRSDFYRAETVDEAKAISTACRNTIPAPSAQKRDDPYKEIRTFFNTLEDSVFSEPIYNYFLFPPAERFTNAALENFHKYLKLYINRTHGVSYDVLRYSVLFGKLNRKPMRLPFTADKLDDAVDFCTRFELSKSSWRFIRRDAYNGYMLNNRRPFHEGSSFIEVCNAILAMDRHLYFYNYYSRFADVLPLLLQRIRELRESLERQEPVCPSLEPESEPSGYSGGNSAYGIASDWWYEVQEIHPLSDLIEKLPIYCYLGSEDTALYDAEEKHNAELRMLGLKEPRHWFEDD